MAESRAAIAGRLAGAAARSLMRNRLNVAAIAGIIAMTEGAREICGAGVALAVFGSFTWITTVIAAEIATRVKPEA